MVIKKLLSKDPRDVVWLAWGASKLRGLAAGTNAPFTRNYMVGDDVIVTLRHDPAVEAADFVRVLRRNKYVLKTARFPNPIPYRAYIMSVVPPNPVAPYILPNPPGEDDPAWAVYIPEAIIDVQYNAGYYHSEAADANTGGVGYPYDFYTLTHVPYLAGDCAGPPPSIPSAYGRWSGTAKYVHVGSAWGWADCEGGYEDYYSTAAAAAVAENAKTTRKEHYTSMASDGTPGAPPTSVLAPLPSPGDIPEDCITFLKPVLDDSYDSYYGASPGLEEFNEWWSQMSVANSVRATAWFKKNSDTVLDQMRAGTFVPSSKWEALLKENAPPSAVFRRNSPLVVTLLSDTGPPGNNTRTYELKYSVPVNGVYVQRTTTVVGTKTVETLEVAPYTTTTTYTNWYDAAGAHPPRLLQDYLYGDNGDSFGSVFNGVITTGHHPDSTFDSPTTDYNLIKNYPPHTDTVVSTALPFVLQYRSEVPMRPYDAERDPPTADNNDTALYDKQEVSIGLFGPAGKGIFATWGVSDTQIEVFGTAIFVHSQGGFTLKSWRVAKGTAEAPNTGTGPVLVNRPTGPAPNINAIIGYNFPRYPDSVSRAAAETTAIRTTDPFTSAVFAVL